MLAFQTIMLQNCDMFNETQKRRVAERLATELDEPSAEQVEKVGNLVFRVSALGVGRDVDYLLGVLDPESGADETIVKAAGICLTELAANN